MKKDSINYAKYLNRESKRLSSRIPRFSIFIKQKLIKMWEGFFNK